LLKGFFTDGLSINVMTSRKSIFLAGGIALAWAGGASGFRNCDMQDSDSWSAATSYMVGELSFDEVTGLASGTETLYNHSNTYVTGEECHVTYELEGNYVPGSEVFVLSATRSSYSESCPPELLEAQYPANLQRNFQMAFAADGSARLNSADNGDFLAEGSWQRGSTTYKTGERCSMF
jgi:hypothetical protein